jgi:hypothetical protein
MWLFKNWVFIFPICESFLMTIGTANSRTRITYNYMLGDGYLNDGIMLSLSLCSDWLGSGVHNPSLYFDFRTLVTQNLWVKSFRRSSYIISRGIHPLLTRLSQIASLTKGHSPTLSGKRVGLLFVQL